MKTGKGNTRKDNESIGRQSNAVLVKQAREKDVSISVLIIALEEACKEAPHDEQHYVAIATDKVMGNLAE